MPKIQAENLGGKFLRKILAENSCGKFRRLTKFRRVYRIYAPGKNWRTIELWRTLKSPRLGEISAPSQNLSGKVWRPLTIWARQNLPLLTSSLSG
jgi:hypothetical protein